MKFGQIDIQREQMPSYQIGQEYPLRRYQFMQDTLNNALAQRQQLMGNPVQTQAANPAQQNSQWNGGAQ